MAMEITVQRDTTSYKRCGIVLRDATTGKAKTGLVAADLTARYERGNAASASITLADLAAFTSAYSSGKLHEDGSTGQYRFDIPDAVLATGADSAKDATVVISGADILDFVLHIDLTDYAADVVDPDLAAVKAKTDNLPSDPADQSLVIAATDAIYNRIGAAGVGLTAVKLAANGMDSIPGYV